MVRKAKLAAAGREKGRAGYIDPRGRTCRRVIEGRAGSLHRAGDATLTLRRQNLPPKSPRVYPPNVGRTPVIGHGRARSQLCPGEAAFRRRIYDRSHLITSPAQPDDFSFSSFRSLAREMKKGVVKSEKKSLPPFSLFFLPFFPSIML